MAIRPMGGEMDEDMFENEEFYEDVGAAEGKDGPLPKFNARKYGNPKELRRAMHQLGDRLRKRLEKLARKEQRALQALAAKKLQALHQIQTRLQTAKQAAGEAQKDAVNTFLQELEDAGQELIAGPKLSGALEDNEAAREAAKEAFRRSVRGAVDIKTHLATLQEIDTEHDVEANRIRARSEAQTAALQTINATLHTTLAKAEADAETAKARLEAKANKAESTIRRAAEKTRNNIKSRLEAIPAYWQAREEAIEYLERQDDPSLEGHLSPGQVEARGRYLAQDEYRNYITRAKHPRRPLRRHRRDSSLRQSCSGVRSPNRARSTPGPKTGESGRIPPGRSGGAPSKGEVNPPSKRPTRGHLKTSVFTCPLSLC